MESKDQQGKVRGKVPARDPVARKEAELSVIQRETEAAPTPVKKQNKPPSLLTIKAGYETADYFSGKSSEINRQLALAGIAVIWVFKIDTSGQTIVPGALVIPGLLLITGLAFDLLQYVIAGEVWRRITSEKERAGISEFTVKPWVNVFGDTLYWLKITATVIAYGFLIRFLANRLL